MLIILFSIICAFIWGISEIFYKKTTHEYSTSNVFFYRYISQIIFYTIFVIIKDISVFSRFNLKLLLAITPVILIANFAGFIYVYCLRNGKLSIVSPLMASDPIFIIIIGLMLFKESQSLMSIICLAIICISICALNFVSTKDTTKASKLSIVLATVYAFLMALSTTFEKSIYLGGYTTADFIFHYTILIAISLLVLSIYMVFTKKKIQKINKNVILTFPLTHIGNIMYSVLISTAYVSLVVPITSLYSVVTQILAKKILKEKLTLFQRIFILIIIVATILLSIFK